MPPEIRNIITRSQKISTERQELLDHLWQLEKESQELQTEFFAITGAKEVELSFTMEGKRPKITGIKYKKATD